MRNSYFHDNENGILTGANLESDIIIEHSEFAHNGSGDGQSHNLYIGTVRTFTLRYSYVHHAIVGHNVKSRAIKSYITFNRIMDEKLGRASYAIDLPDCGLSLIGNLIQQGPANDNRTIVAYGAEGIPESPERALLRQQHNGERRPVRRAISLIKTGADAARIVNNLFSGPGEWLAGRGEMRNNARVAKSDFVDTGSFDYRLRQGASAIGRGLDPGSAYGSPLRPSAEYVHRARMRARSTSGAIDLGGLEYR